MSERLKRVGYLVQEKGWGNIYWKSSGELTTLIRQNKVIWFKSDVVVNRNKDITPPMVWVDRNSRDARELIIEELNGQIQTRQKA